MQLKATLRIGTVVVGSWLVLTILETRFTIRVVVKISVPFGYPKY